MVSHSSKVSLALQIEAVATGDNLCTWIFRCLVLFAAQRLIVDKRNRVFGVLALERKHHPASCERE